MAGSVHSEDGDPGFQIAPMVDVVFVLLLFFMASAGMRMTEKQLAIALPGRASFLPPADEPMIIDITADGTVSVNNLVVGFAGNRALPKLKEFLANVHENFGNGGPVIIRPSPDSRQERIIDVLDACAAGGVKKLTFS